MNQFVRTAARWMSARPSWMILTLVLLLMVPVLSACGPSNGQGLAVGDSAPSFSLPEATGGQVSLADYRGSKPVLLYFHMADG
jgi:hypothetical protein